MTQAQVAKKTLIGMVPVASPFYGYHPVSRLALLIVLSVVPMFITMPEVNLALIVLALLLLRWGRVQTGQLKKYLPLLVTVALFMFTVAYLAPGNRAELTEVRVLGVPFYFEPMWWAFVSYVRLVAMLFGAILYFSTNRERDILVGLRTVRVPFVVTYVVGLALRSAGMFMEDFVTIRQAEQARGLDLEKLSLVEKVKLYTMYIVPLFAVALRRADEISTALFARGYTLTGRPTTGGKRSDYLRSRYVMQRRDWVVSLGLIAAFVVVAVLSMTTDIVSHTNSALRAGLVDALGVTL